MDQDRLPTGPLCGRCYAETELFPANCEEKPETKGRLGMYHCPDCGAMIMGGIPHFPLCKLCLERKHPSYDEMPKEDESSEPDGGTEPGRTSPDM